MRSVSCLNGLTLPLKSIFESLAYVNLKVYSFQDHFFIISIESTMWSFRIHLRHVFVFAIACTVQPCSVCGFEVLYQLHSLIFEMEQIQSQPTSELISFLLMIVMELQRRLATQSERPVLEMFCLLVIQPIIRLMALTRLEVSTLFQKHALIHASFVAENAVAIVITECTGTTGVICTETGRNMFFWPYWPSTVWKSLFLGAVA